MLSKDRDQVAARARSCAGVLSNEGMEPGFTAMGAEEFRLLDRLANNICSETSWVAANRRKSPTSGHEN